MLFPICYTHTDIVGNVVIKKRADYSFTAKRRFHFRLQRNTVITNPQLSSNDDDAVVWLRVHGRSVDKKKREAAAIVLHVN